MSEGNEERNHNKRLKFECSLVGQIDLEMWKCGYYKVRNS